MDKLDAHESKMLWALAQEKAVGCFDYAQRHDISERESFDRWIREAKFWQDIADKIKPED